MQVGVNLIIV